MESTKKEESRNKKVTQYRCFGSPVILCIVLLNLFQACTTEVADEEQLANIVQPIIIGADDDRYEYGAIDTSLVKRAADATAINISSAWGVDCGSSTCEIETQRWLQYQSSPLCEDVPFSGQLRSIAADGTSFLVGPDLFITVQHVIGSQQECDATKVVFGFTADENGENETTEVPVQDVYDCEEIVASGGESGAETGDWTVFRVDRNVTNRVPLIIERTSNIEDDRTIFVTGHPTGLTLKVAPGKVTSTYPSGGEFGLHPGFIHNGEVRLGNSGSPITSLDTGIVYGINTSGTADFEYDDEEGCYSEINWSCEECGASTSENIIKASDYVPLHSALIIASVKI